MWQNHDSKCFNAYVAEGFHTDDASFEDNLVNGKLTVWGLNGIDQYGTA